MPAEIAQSAPEFAKTTNANEGISLSSLRGKNVILAFIVHAFTGG
ncbi:MAG: redoxin domain-containing protein [Chloroflexi bacterium]|nr:redoxin domain-containing protein [Chloroflexota bacterium]